ncbi:arylesterase [Bordetella bronchiseptica]|uniref:arylesterase n=1 Tax=Bordetella bronchiseptica TaxID=518 RepID=UPI00081D1082|nr:arylesterase [Bordetella bronchiseptica]AOB26662.1 arylesterase [Bordetella bronchiseptica]
MRIVFRLLVPCLAATAFAAALPAQAQTAAAPAGSAARAVLVVGDSLSAEYGLRRGSGWVPMLARRVSQQYPNYRVVNASISGDTTSGGLARLPALLRQHAPAVVVLELGSNDALRGLALDMTERNLRAMAQASRQAGAAVLLVGMQIPPNYGRAYTQRFAQVFPAVAEQEKARLVPFLMEGIATNRAMFQADGIHPNEDAQPALLDNVWPVLEPMLAQPAAD